jgi:hypothetical protein
MWLRGTTNRDGIGPKLVLRAEIGDIELVPTR